MSFRGPSPCDAANFFLGADGKQKPSRNAYISGPRKRTREGGDEKSIGEVREGEQVHDHSQVEVRDGGRPDVPRVRSR